MFFIARGARYFVAAGFIVVALALGMTGEALGQVGSNECGVSGYSYNAACGGNASSPGTTVTASSIAIAASAATQGLVANRLSSFRAGNSAPGGRASNSTPQQVFAFGTQGSDLKAPKLSNKEAAERKQALKEANGRYDQSSGEQAFTVGVQEERASDRLGVSAGENPDNRFGLWANGAYFNLDGSKTRASFDSDVTTAMVGLDYRFGPRLLIGLAAGYESTDGDTTFNRGTIESDGYIVSPYFSLGLTDKIGFDGVFGYGKIDYDMTRRDALSNALITGSTEGTRWFGSLDLVAGHRINQWMLEGRVGASHLNEEQDSFRESNTNHVASNDITVSSANLGARLGYSFTLVEPYIAGLYSYDFNKAEGAYDDRNTFGGAAGLNFTLTPSLGINLEGKATHKEDLDAYGGSATVRLNF